MKRTIWAMALAALLAAPFLVAADDGDQKKDEGKGTPIQRILKELKTLVDREKSKPEYDADLVKDIEKLVKSFEKQVKPVTLDDLTEEDRARLEDEVRKKIEEERRAAGGGGGGGDWQSRAVERTLEGVDLKDDEKEKVTALLVEYQKDVGVAYRNQDYKLVGDLKKDLEKQLTREIGRNRAKDIMNNVNRQFGGRGGWGR